MYRKLSKKFNKTMVILTPGEYYATKDKEIISTAVGSCIATCLFDAKNGIAGMSHFLLPGVVNAKNVLSTEIGRYGMYAMEVLIGDLIKLGADREKIKAKVFGGGSVLRFRQTDGNIPQSNIQFIRRFLKIERIPLVKEDVGESRVRIILFFSDTGKTLLKKLPYTSVPDTVRREEKYKVTLFRKRVQEPPFVF